MYTIVDQFTNYLQHTGRFNFSAYGAYKGAPMEFPSFDDAVEYIDAHLDACREDLTIIDLDEECLKYRCLNTGRMLRG